jgi:ABC-2 type transport system permease protein
MLEKASAVTVCVGIVALGTFLGMLAGVAIAGGGISAGDSAAFALHLVLFGLVTGAVALALAGATGRKAVAVGGAAAVGVVGFLINGFAPLVDAVDWLKYVSPFYYYAEHDPLGRGVDLADLAILAGATALLTAVAAISFRARDLRA